MLLTELESIRICDASKSGSFTTAHLNDDNLRPFRQPRRVLVDNEGRTTCLTR
jgi:hypothetical protein